MQRLQRFFIITEAVSPVELGRFISGRFWFGSSMMKRGVKVPAALYWFMHETRDRGNHLANYAGGTLNTADGTIAATAFEHDLTVVARNVKDFARLGVRIFKPWD